MVSDNGRGDGPKRISIDTVLTEPELPGELVFGPQVPEGTDADFFLHRPPFLITARILGKADADKINNTIYQSDDDDGRSNDKPASFTILELLIINQGGTAATIDKPSDYKLRATIFEEPSKWIDAANSAQKRQAENCLGKDNVLTKALDLDVKSITIPPGMSWRWLNYYTPWWSNKCLLPELIYKIYCGPWPMWPTRPRAPPPGLKVPAEGVLKVFLYRPDKGDPRFSEPEAVIIDRGINLKGRNEWGEEVGFFTDQPIVVPAGQDVGFVRIVAERPGDSSIVGPGAIDTYSRYGRELTAVTNPLPTWDPRSPPPIDTLVPWSLRRNWLVTTEVQRPLVAAEGSLFAVAVEDRLWVFDARGNLKHSFETDWYPYSLAFGRGGRAVFMGHDNTLVEFDLERNRQYDLQELPVHIDNLSVRQDGTVVASGEDGDGGILTPVDQEARVLKGLRVNAKDHISCARDADATLVWNGYAYFQVVDSRGRNLAEKKCQSENFDGVAISPDGTMIAAGEYGDKLSILDIKDDLAVRATYRTIGLPHALAFHPTRPLVFAATRNSYLHVFHIEKGPIFTRRIEGYVANDMAFGERACILSMMDGYLHNLSLDDDTGEV